MERNNWDKKYEMVIEEEPRDLKREVSYVASFLVPHTLDDADTRDPVAAWDALLDSPKALLKVRNIVLDTGDVTKRHFTKMLFLGCGTRSLLDREILFDRVRYGVELLNDWQQGGNKNPEELRDVVRDVAMALLGDDVSFHNAARDGKQ